MVSAERIFFGENVHFRQDLFLNVVILGAYIVGIIFLLTAAQNKEEHAGKKTQNEQNTNY